MLSPPSPWSEGLNGVLRLSLRGLRVLRSIANINFRQVLVTRRMT